MAMAHGPFCAEVLSIGDELIHGSNLDTNARWLAGRLEQEGVEVRRFTVVGDDPALLQAAMREACSRVDLVLATGGLGPTLDDRTRDVAAAVAGGPLWFCERSWQEVSAWLTQRKRPVPDSNRRQAEFPPGAVPISNPVGTAPGFRVQLGRATLFAYPGVPREMQRMVEDSLLPWLSRQPGLMPVVEQRLFVLGPSEAALGERIADFMHPGREPAVGITASGGLLTVRIVARAADRGQATAAALATAAQLRPLLGAWLVAEGTSSLHEIVAARLMQSGASFALAESCTGGLCASRICAVPGISSVFQGGIVSYSNEAKRALLDVDAALLEQHGAVSEPVAAAMALGASRRLQARLAVAVTGIAGPGGGSEQKPVGTVAFGVCLDGAARAFTRTFANLGREFIQERAVAEVWTTVLGELAALEAGRRG